MRNVVEKAQRYSCDQGEGEMNTTASLTVYAERHVSSEDRVLGEYEDKRLAVLYSCLANLITERCVNLGIK
ncbi:MAG: hypothetical protein AAGN15_00540 [Cyanobacteria bacterium J06581_3]